MKKTTSTLLIILFFAVNSFYTHAQTKKLENPFETNGNINDQLNYLFKTSTNYLEYKVISKAGYSKMHKNVLDTIAYNKSLLEDQILKNKTQLIEIETLNKELKSIKEELKSTSENKDSISVLGTKLHKSNYNLIVVILLISLLGIAAFFLYKFTNSNIVTKQSQKQLEEAQLELETVQKSALKRQQELSRKLQDEIIKNSKN